MFLSCSALYFSDNQLYLAAGRDMFETFERRFRVSQVLVRMAEAEMEQIKTFRDFMSNYNKLSETCFADCVWDFTTRCRRPPCSP